MTSVLHKGVGLLTGSVLLLSLICQAQQPAVHLQPTNTVGPRTLEKPTETSVVRGYLEAWRTMDAAFSGNRPELLQDWFIGGAKDKLAAAVRGQQQNKLSSAYEDRSHNLQILFYSPEGLSIELVDDVEYEVEVRENGQSQGKQNVHASYVAILTPTETRWKVRVFQAISDAGEGRASDAKGADSVQGKVQGAGQ